jgi:hypothetical protein
MANCAFCNGPLKRLHRTPWEKMFYQAMYKCSNCGQADPLPRKFTFLFWLHARCPSCGTGRLTRLAGRDPVDRLFRNPFSLIQAAFGGKLFHCNYCRLQFYDVRPLLQRAREKARRTA